MRLVLALMMTTLVSVVAGPGASAAPIELKWQQLVPEFKDPLVDPLSSLTQDQRFDFETVVWVRGLDAEQKKLPENEQGVIDAEKYERNFKRAGIDVTSLMVKYAEWEKKIAERQKRVVEDLDQKAVRIPGYLLPLEFSDAGVRDFLLVPYVGACIHVPPPPPNQIVLVRLANKFQVTELYTPVWVSGKLQTKASSKSLTLVDGARDISIGYSIDAAAVEVYKEK